MAPDPVMARRAELLADAIDAGFECHMPLTGRQVNPRSRAIWEPLIARWRGAHQAMYESGAAMLTELPAEGRYVRRVVGLD
jgi:hypothetical protein